MLSAQEFAVNLFNSALKQSMYLSDTLKKDNAKEIALNQLFVAKQILFDSQLIEERTTPIRKTIDYIDTVKNIINSL